MSQTDFRNHYEQLSDDELLTVAADREHLVVEAAAALDSEVRRRGAKMVEPKWFRDPRSDENVQSLQDYQWYQQLSKKQQFMNKYTHLLAMGPFILAIVVATTLFKNSELLAAFFVGLTLIWTLLVLTYSLVLIVRWAGFKCPQCRNRFGTDDECWSCGFPRGPKQRVLDVSAPTGGYYARTYCLRATNDRRKSPGRIRQE